MMIVVIFFAVTVVVLFVVRFETACAMTFFNVVFFIGIVMALFLFLFFFLFLRATDAIFSPTPETSHYVSPLNPKFCRSLFYSVCMSNREGSPLQKKQCLRRWHCFFLHVFFFIFQIISQSNFSSLQ